MSSVTRMSLASLAGLVVSQIAGHTAPHSAEVLRTTAGFVSKVCLAFIMIGVGLEFKSEGGSRGSRLRVVLAAVIAAAVPWFLVSAYFVTQHVSRDAWLDPSQLMRMLLLGRFAAPTSAGVLLTMLASAGLGATWLFRKTRVLSVYDDIDTILMAVVLQCAIAGLRWQLAFVVPLNIMLLVAWKLFARRLRWPSGWRWRLVYAGAMVVVAELTSLGLTAINPAFPVHLEILLPAFVLGVLLQPDAEGEHERSARASARISMVFMVTVGLSLPVLVSTGGTDPMRPRGILLGVIALTLLGNAGKMVVAVFFRSEASLRSRLALGVAMCLRGEVGIGMACLASSYGVPPSLVAMSMLTVVVNLMLTGPALTLIQWLLREKHAAPLTLLPAVTTAGHHPAPVIARACSASLGRLASREGAIRRRAARVGNENPTRIARSLGSNG